MFLGTERCCWDTEGCLLNPKSVFSQLGVGSLPAGALDDSEWVHMRILQTIYQQLTCSKLGCPRYGAHWEELGFQGRRGSNPLPGEDSQNLFKPPLEQFCSIPALSATPCALSQSTNTVGVVMVRLISKCKRHTVRDFSLLTAVHSY